MGVHISIQLTPYINIKKIKSIDIPKVKRVCPNHSTFKARDEKFCPTCGAEIINQEYTVSEPLQPYKVFQAAGLEEDTLYSVEYLDSILKPNHRPPNHIEIEEENSGAINLIDKQDLINQQINWFKEKYAQYIKVLEEAYGTENIEVCWGLLHYWS